MLNNDEYQELKMIREAIEQIAQMLKNIWESEFKMQ
jgi:hypothetical protein